VLNKSALQLTWVFAIAGLTEVQSAANLYSAAVIRATQRNRQQNVSSAKYLQWSICTGWTFNECPAIANTLTLCATNSDFCKSI